MMLTARALTREDVLKAFRCGASYFVPKEYLYKLDLYLADIFKERQGQEAVWKRWHGRLRSFFEGLFGLNWFKTEKDLWDKLSE